jgi:hypothetical protein
VAPGEVRLPIGCQARLSFLLALQGEGAGWAGGLRPRPLLYRCRAFGRLCVAGRAFSALPEGLCRR